MTGQDALLDFDTISDKTLKCNEIKYAAYRTAAKLRIWQKSLFFDHVTLSVVRNVFNHHHILVTDTRVILSSTEVDNLLNDIFYAASKLAGEFIDIDKVVELTSKFLNSVFKSHEGLNILDLKVGLVCLCAAPLNEKYCYLFSQLADHNLCLTRKRVKRLLESLTRLPCFLGEFNSFNVSYIDSTLDSCFSKSSELGVSESQFICWIVQEPQLLIWLSTLYRFQASEKVSHNVRCAVCSIKPIQGLRYICMRCISYDMCQHCFFTGKKSKRHVSQHEIREYCAKASPCETLLLYVKGVFGRMFGSTSRLQYLPAVASDSSPNSDSTFTIAQPEACLSPRRLSDTSCLAKPEDQLNIIIERIEEETRNFMDAAKSNAVPEVIERHTTFLNEQLNCLRSLKMGLQRNEAAIFMSTPIAPLHSKHQVLQTPLLLEDESTWAIPSPNDFSVWQKGNACGETSYSLKLQQDLEMIMIKLNGLIDQTNEVRIEDESLTAL